MAVYLQTDHDMYLMYQRPMPRQRCRCRCAHVMRLRYDSSMLQLWWMQLRRGHTLLPWHRMLCHPPAPACCAKTDDDVQQNQNLLLLNPACLLTGLPVSHTQGPAGGAVLPHWHGRHPATWLHTPRNWAGAARGHREAAAAGRPDLSLRQGGRGPAAGTNSVEFLLENVEDCASGCSTGAAMKLCKTLASARALHCLARRNSRNSSWPGSPVAGVEGHHVVCAGSSQTPRKPVWQQLDGAGMAPGCQLTPHALAYAGVDGHRGAGAGGARRPGEGLFMVSS